MSKAEDLSRQYVLPFLDKHYEKYGEHKQIELTRFDGYDIMSAYEEGYYQAEKDVLDVIEKKLTRRMLEDYNEGAEEDEIERDEIAQGCMASLIMFVRQMKEE